MQTGSSAYHSTLASALARHAQDYQANYEKEFSRFGRLTEAIEAIEEKRIVLILLAHSLVEALANMVFAFKLDALDFAKADRMSIVEKWTAGMRSLLPQYQLQPELRADLNSLRKRRNGITHMKPELSREGKLVHKGNAPRMSPSEHEAILRWVNLPMKLLENLSHYDKSFGGMLYVTTQYDLIRGKRRRGGTRTKTTGVAGG